MKQWIFTKSKDGLIVEEIYNQSDKNSWERVSGVIKCVDGNKIVTIVNEELYPLMLNVWTQLAEEKLGVMLKPRREQK
jgi:hypothetical protein